MRTNRLYGHLLLVSSLAATLIACPDDDDSSSSSNQDDDSGVTDSLDDDWWSDGDDDWWTDGDDDLAGTDGSVGDGIGPDGAGDGNDFDGPPRFTDVERECEYGETQVCRCEEERFNSELDCIGYDWGPCHCREDEDDEYSAFVIENLNEVDDVLVLAQGDSTGEVIGVLTEEDEIGTRFTGVYYSDAEGNGFVAYVDEAGYPTEVVAHDGTIVRMSNYEFFYVDVEVITPEGVVNTYERIRLQEFRAFREWVEENGLYIDVNREKDVPGPCDIITNEYVDLALNIGAGTVSSVGCIGAAVTGAGIPIAISCGSVLAGFLNEMFAEGNNRGVMHGTSVGLDLQSCLGSGFIDRGSCGTAATNFLRSYCYEEGPELDELCVPRGGGTVCDGSTIYYLDSCGSRTEAALRCESGMSCETGSCGCPGTGTPCSNTVCADQGIGYCGGWECSDTGQCVCPSIGECGDGELLLACDNYRDLVEMCDPGLPRDQWSSRCGEDDFCDSRCQCTSNRTLCQNGSLDSAQGEECDSTVAPTGCGLGTTCNVLCECEADCGDGIIAAGLEDCDPEADVTGCGVGNDCNPTTCECESDGSCGNGDEDEGEECGEPGLTCGSGTCIECSCCGDGNTDPGEGCDDGDGNTDTECEPGDFVSVCTYCTTECQEIEVGTPTELCESSYGFTSDDDPDFERIRFCNTITGSVSVGGDVTSLSRLSHIVEIRGNLSISWTTDLTSVAGLESARLLGEITVRDNDELTNLNGLGGGGTPAFIAVTANPKLTAIGGLGSITETTYGISLSSNPLLTDVSSLASIKIHSLGLNNNAIQTATFRLTEPVTYVTINEHNLTSLSLGSFNTMTGGFTLQNTELTTVSFPASTALYTRFYENELLTALSMPALSSLGPTPDSISEVFKLRGNVLLGGQASWLPALRTVDGGFTVRDTLMDDTEDFAPNLTSITGDLGISGVNLIRCEAQEFIDRIDVGGTAINGVSTGGTCD